MANYTLPYFGEIDTDSLEECYDVEIDFDGRKIDLDLNFDGEAIDPKRLDKVKAFLAKLAAYDANNKTAIEEDYDDEHCDTARTYVEWHLQELGEDGLAHLLEPGAGKLEVQLLKKLHLVRLGLYPDSEEDFAIFDYSINKETTDHLVVLFTDENGTLDYMTMES